MGLTEAPTYDLNELADRAGVTARTVRYYIQQGLLPAPEAQGPSTRYGQGHLDRLLLIRHLQREHQPLAEIRTHLEGLRDEDVTRVLSSHPAKRPSSAVDYVRSVLAGKTGSPRELAVRASALAVSAPPPTSASKSQWERIVLAPDVELHLRRPLTRETNRRVEKLLDLARQILQEGE